MCVRVCVCVCSPRRCSPCALIPLLPPPVSHCYSRALLMFLIELVGAVSSNTQCPFSFSLPHSTPWAASNAATSWDASYGPTHGPRPWHASSASAHDGDAAAWAPRLPSALRPSRTPTAWHERADAPTRHARCHWARADAPTRHARPHWERADATTRHARRHWRGPASAAHAWHAPARLKGSHWRRSRPPCARSAPTRHERHETPASSHGMFLALCLLCALPGGTPPPPPPLFL